MNIILMFLLVLFFSPAVFAENTQYDIVATYQEQDHRIEGVVEVSFVNGGTEPVSELYLVLYPNRYRLNPSGLGLPFFRQAYPAAFNPGGLVITSIQDEAGNLLLPFSNPGGENTLIKVSLSSPIPPQEKYHFSIGFVTKIPQKWGVFGYYKDLVTLQGGWYPYLVNRVDGEWSFHGSPQNSKHHIRLTLKKDLHVLGSAPPDHTSFQGEDQTFVFKGDNIPFFSLSIGRDRVRYRTRVEKIDITYHALSKDKSYAQKVIDISEAATSFFSKRYGPISSTRLELAEARLYQNLTTPGTNLLYINTRFFKVFTTLKRFHETSLAYGLYRLLWRKLRPDEPWWVIECLARHDAEAFMIARHGKGFNLSDWLKPISFFPVVDQILYTENVPMRQVYFNESVKPIVNEDIRFFNNPSSENSSIFSKLRYLLGDETMERVLSAYHKGDSRHLQPFREVLSEVSGRNLNGLIDQWLTTDLKLDSGIKDIKTRQVNGIYENTFSIQKKGEGIEPLQIIVHEKGGAKIPLVWDGVGKSHQVILKTKERIKAVQLDPNRLSSDPNRLNNRVPHKLKVLLDDFKLNFDFQTKGLSYRAGLLFQRLYDTENWVQFRFGKSETADFLNLEYARRVRKNHVLRTALTYEATEADPENNRLQDNAAFFTLGYSFVFPDIPLLTASAQRLTATFPSFNVGISYNQQFNANVYDNSFLIKLDFRRFHTFSNYHEVGGRIFIGQSFGKLLDESRFFLGGSSEMRGLTTLAFEGENKALYSLEYRFPLFYETDINIFGLTHTHTWQGVIFTDTGMVSDSHNVFQLGQYQSDVGFGIRFFVDLFGVQPAIIRADAAMPIASPKEDEQKVHYYLNFGHSF